jgi:predicted solute-binding protein
MNTLWNEATSQDFPMGVLIARREFAEKRADDLKIVLRDLKASIDDVNTASDEVCQKIVDKGFLGEPAIAKKAIPNCSLCLYADEDGDSSMDKGIEIMKTFNETMFKVSPQSVGGSVPEDDLYLK